MSCYLTLCQKNLFCVAGYVTNLTYTYEGCGLAPNYAKWWCCPDPNYIDPVDSSDEKIVVNMVLSILILVFVI